MMKTVQFRRFFSPFHRKTTAYRHMQSENRTEKNLLQNIPQRAFRKEQNRWMEACGMELTKNEAEQEDDGKKTHEEKYEKWKITK